MCIQYLETQQQQKKTKKREFLNKFKQQRNGIQSFHRLINDSLLSTSSAWVLDKSDSFGIWFYNRVRVWDAVWPDWTIYWYLGNFLKPPATLCWPKLLDNFWKGVRIFHFSSENFLIILGNFLSTLGNILLKPSGHPGGQKNWKISKTKTKDKNVVGRAARV